MSKCAKRILWITPTVLLLAILALVALFPRRPKGPSLQELRLRLDAAFHREVQRLYRHEMLSLYDPPAEAFTEEGYRLLKSIQEKYSKVFLPYLVSGSTLIQPDVFYNPFFDMFLLVEDREGLVNSIIVASSLSGGQRPQREVEDDYWRQFYRRYQVAQLATFQKPTPYMDFSYPILQLRNLTNNYHWPPRISLTTAKVPFDLYIQQPGQAIYCTPVEPGAYVIFNVISNQLRTNLMVLPPYVIKDTQKAVQQQIDESNEIGERLLQETKTEAGLKK